MFAQCTSCSVKLTGKLTFYIYFKNVWICHKNYNANIFAFKPDLARGLTIEVLLSRIERFF